jgi:hypothetical protein
MNDYPPAGRWTRKHIVPIVFVFLLPVAGYYAYDHYVFEKAVDEAQRRTTLCKRPFDRSYIETQLEQMHPQVHNWQNAAQAFWVMRCPNPNFPSP